MRSDIFEHRMVLGTASIPYLKPDLEDIKNVCFDVIQTNSDVKIMYGETQQLIFVVSALYW